MEKSAKGVIDEAEAVMDGCTALLYFRLANITVEANPLALLSATVKIGDNETPIEDVASTSLSDKYTFSFMPNSSEYTFPLIKGLKREHPEYEIEIVDVPSSSVKFSAEEREELGLSDNNEDEEASKYILCKMPDMDDSRRDNCTDVTNATCQTSISQINAKKVKFEAVLTKRTVGLPPDQVEEAKGALDDLCEKAIQECEMIKEAKIQSIEEAYQMYLSKQEESMSSGAKGEDDVAGMQMNMNE